MADEIAASQSPICGAVIPTQYRYYTNPPHFVSIPDMWGSYSDASRLEDFTEQLVSIPDMWGSYSDAAAKGNLFKMQSLNPRYVGQLFRRKYINDFDMFD